MSVPFINSEPRIVSSQIPVIAEIGTAAQGIGDTACYACCLIPLAVATLFLLFLRRKRS